MEWPTNTATRTTGPTVTIPPSNPPIPPTMTLVPPTNPSIPPTNPATATATNTPSTTPTNTPTIPPTFTSTTQGGAACVNTSGTVPANSTFIPIGTYNLAQGQTINFQAVHTTVGRTTGVAVSSLGAIYGDGSASWQVTVPSTGAYTFSTGGGSPGTVSYTLRVTGPGC